MRTALLSAVRKCGTRQAKSGATPPQDCPALQEPFPSGVCSIRRVQRQQELVQLQERARLHAAPQMSAHGVRKRAASSRLHQLLRPSAFREAYTDSNGWTDTNNMGTACS